MNLRMLSPQSRDELLHSIADLQSHPFRLGAGYTDLWLELKKAPSPGLIIVNLGQLADEDFHEITVKGGGLIAGSMVTAAQLCLDGLVALHYPVLWQAASVLASRQIRQVATLGGNLCTASPAGDIACALVALNATCELLRADGSTRTVPIQEFFTGVRKTALARDELLLRVALLPNLPNSTLYSGFLKVGIRRSMECAVVSLAWHLQLSPEREILSAGVAIGSAAPTIVHTRSACDFLVGKQVDSLDRDAIANFAELVTSVASPISDKRASADYRRRVLYNISKGMLESLPA